MSLNTKRQRSDSGSSDSGCGSSGSSERYMRKSKNLEGYNPDWKEQFPWLLPVVDQDEPGSICGLLCVLCQRYKIVQRSGVGTWSVKSCRVLRKDTIHRHADSTMHKEALECEATRLSIEKYSGIQQAFQRQKRASKGKL